MGEGGSDRDVQARIPVLLASGSARRRELLTEAGFEVCCQPPDIDETPVVGEAPDEFVCRMAREKAAAAAVTHPQAIVVAADTVIALDGAIIGKPQDRADAAAILRSLADRAHQVLTGVCIQRGNPLFLHNWYVSATVRFGPISETALHTYLNEANWHDKAGAYAIQEHGQRFVTSFTGLRSTIVGLPIEQVAERIQAAHAFQTNATTR